METKTWYQSAVFYEVSLCAFYDRNDLYTPMQSDASPQAGFS
jgi:hypothetical protein